MGAAEKIDSPESKIPMFLQIAVVDAFQVQAGLKVTVGEVVMEPSDVAASSIIDCMSVIGVKNENLQGSLALGFPKTTFLKIVEKMIGEQHQSISNEIADASGELLNIVYASARVKMNEVGLNFQPAIPTTVLGKELSLSLGVASKYLKFTCECEFGKFFVALNLKRTK